MTENFKASWFDEAYDCNTIKLSYQLGRMENYDKIFDAIFSTHKVNNIFFGLDFNAIIKAPWQPVLHKIPDYLSDNNIFNDVQYLFNKDVMIDYLLPYVKTNIENKVPNFDDSYLWADKEIFFKKKVIKDYSEVRLKSKVNSTMTNEQAMKYAEDNMKVITKYIEENPNTTFYIFYPPYGILAFDELIMKNDLKNIMDVMQYSAGVLLNYDNVKLYLFQNMQDTITNIDLYKDTAHYNQDVNKLMLQYMKNGEYLLTKDNYKEEFSKMREFLENYDYDALFE